MPAVNDAAIAAIRSRFSALPRETLVALVAAYLRAAKENDERRH
jgi:hypothetical protein